MHWHWLHSYHWQNEVNTEHFSCHSHPFVLISYCFPKRRLRPHLVGTSSGCQRSCLQKKCPLLSYADERNNDQEKPSQLFGFKLITVRETIWTVPRNYLGFWFVLLVRVDWERNPWVPPFMCVYGTSFVRINHKIFQILLHIKYKETLKNRVQKGMG